MPNRSKPNNKESAKVRKTLAKKVLGDRRKREAQGMKLHYTQPPSFRANNRKKAAQG